MRKRTERKQDSAVYVDAEGLAAIISCGRSTAIKIGKAAGARVQIGKSVRYSVEKVKAYLDDLTGPAA